MPEPGDPFRPNFVQKLESDAQFESIRLLLIDLATNASLLLFTVKLRKERIEALEKFMLANPSLTFEEVQDSPEAKAYVDADKEMFRLSALLEKSHKAFSDNYVPPESDLANDSPDDPRSHQFDEFLDSYEASTLATQTTLAETYGAYERVKKLGQALKKKNEKDT